MDTPIPLEIFLFKADFQFCRL